MSSLSESLTLLQLLSFSILSLVIQCSLMERFQRGGHSAASYANGPPPTRCNALASALTVAPHHSPVFLRPPPPPLPGECKDEGRGQ